MGESALGGFAARETRRLLPKFSAEKRSDGFHAFLDTMAAEVLDQGKPMRLVPDNASWHHASSLNRHHPKPLYLPPSSPHFDPTEWLWECLKSAKLFFNTTTDGTRRDRMPSMTCPRFSIDGSRKFALQRLRQIQPLYHASAGISVCRDNLPGQNAKLSLTLAALRDF